MKKYLILIITIMFFSCNSTAQKKEETAYKVSKTESEWQAELSKIEFNVLRKEGTEQPFSSPLNKNYIIVQTAIQLFLKANINLIQELDGIVSLEK